MDFSLDNRKPLGRKSYGSIPHLPGSRLGAGDHKISEGRAKIATEAVRDKQDVVIVQEKLDGSNVAVALLKDGRLAPLTRAGYLAETSPYLQHHIFSDWVFANRDRFYSLLNPGEWVSGEWLAQAHGTRYELQHEPLVIFDLWSEGKRLPFAKMSERVDEMFETPRRLHLGTGQSCSIEKVVKAIEDRTYHGALDSIEGAVWRVERCGAVDFLCKYVRPDKQDGFYLPELSGESIVWNLGLEDYLPNKALARLTS